MSTTSKSLALIWQSTRDMKRLLSIGLVLVLFGSAGAGLTAQVDYSEDGNPWKQRANKGPDAEVGGWYYNLGITGLRVQLDAEAPKELIVKYVFAKTPAAKHLRIGDRITGVFGQPFQTPHQDGYGMDKFGPDGPILEFAQAIEKSQAKKAYGKIPLQFRRGKKKKTAVLKLTSKPGLFSATYPEDCPKSDKILDELCSYLVKHQDKNGSWGSPPQDLFAPLALLANGKKKYLAAVKKSAKMHARTTRVQDKSWLINWRYVSAGIVLSEYYLATKEKWVLKELQEINQFLLSTQYMDQSQIAAQTKIDRPQDLPKTKMRAIGGWGHNPGFEGYGPICMITGQATLAMALMKRCGVAINKKRHLAAYDFLARGTGANGYLWYEDQKASDEDWADMGRTGAAGIANFLSPYQDPVFRKRAMLHAKVIGDHPQSFPDTHGSPLMGMGFTALAAHVDPRSFRKLMDANRWWFVLARCPDGSYYYQPNRDNAGFGDKNRIKASAVTAFILAMRKPALHLSGKPLESPNRR